MAEINAYRAERHVRAVPPTPVSAYADAWKGVVAYVLVVTCITFFAWNHVFGLDWLRVGMMDAGKVSHGEIWRTVTALTLHANLGHLGGNLVFGGFFGLFVGRYFGVGVGWCAIVLGGTFGDLLNAWVQPAQHRSIGASTAVFAALGLLTAHAWLRNSGRVSWRARAAPIAAGVGLLAFLGTAGQHTDVMAHLMGFGAGFVIGAVLARIPRLQIPVLQGACAGFACALVACAWLWGIAVAV